MPNWATNNIKIYSPYLSEIKDFVQENDRVFSFNKIIPMPACLDVGSVPSDHTIMANVKEWMCKNDIEPTGKIKELLSVVDKTYSYYVSEQMQERSYKFYKAMTETGYWSWYDWRIEYWGTKWNACDAELIEENEDYLYYRFETAWTLPVPIFEALTKKFKDTTIKVNTIIEYCSGYKATFKDGQCIIDEVIPPDDLLELSNRNSIK